MLCFCSKRPVSLLSGTKNKSNLSGIEHILHFSPKNPKYFCKLKLRIFFGKKKKNLFWPLFITNKDISKIPLKNKKAVYILQEV